MSLASAPPMPILIITCIWIAVIAAIAIYKYKSQADIHLMDTDRRITERRGETENDQNVANAEKRRENDRRDALDLKSEIRAVRDHIENKAEIEGR